MTSELVTNIAAASYRSAAGSDVINLTLICHCPKCDPGPNASEVNCPCIAVLLIVWTCAALLSEELTSVSPFHVSLRPSTILGTTRGIFIGRVDPLCTTEMKGKIPIRRVHPFCTTELQRESL